MVWYRNGACAARHSRAWTWRDEGKTLIESGISIQGELGEIDGRLVPWSPQECRNQCQENYSSDLCNEGE